MSCRFCRVLSQYPHWRNYITPSELPVYWCSIILTDVTSLTSSLTLVTLAIVRRQRYRGVVKSGTYGSATIKCTGKVIKQTIWNYLQYYCLFNLTLQWRWQFWRNNVILSAQVLVKAVGVKLLKVSSTGIAVFWCDAVYFDRHCIRSQRTVTGRGQGRGLWQIVLTPRLGLEV